jgi:hypothetical protein
VVTPYRPVRYRSFRSNWSTNCVSVEVRIAGWPQEWFAIWIYPPSTPAARPADPPPSSAQDWLTPLAKHITGYDNESPGDL